VTLALESNQGPLWIERPRDADRVIAAWHTDAGEAQASVPAREAEGEIIPETGVENLSDLLFWLSGIKPPKVRKSKTKDETELARLSIRDLLWYCYLDQDDMDSNFFHLEEDAHIHKRYKSRDVLRYIVGFHAEHVAVLEGELDELRQKRLALLGSITALERALKNVGVESEADLQLRMVATRSKAEDTQRELVEARRAAQQQVTHAVDFLRRETRSLGDQLAETESAIENVRRRMDGDERHLHEIETLTLKFRRSVSAKAVLTGVRFESCPRCTKPLPDRAELLCPVCGQDDGAATVEGSEIELLERDAAARIAELKDVLGRHRNRLMSLSKERETILLRKERLERERNLASQNYDSAYLSTILLKEREHASLLQEVENLNQLAKFPQLVASQRAEVEGIVAREGNLRSELREARERAERDSASLDRLKELFLDSLLRTRIPGIHARDHVEIKTPGFIPEVYGPEPLEPTVTSFMNMSSGGKKSLFKCCFAIAIHRLALEKAATLPDLLIIDSPMKNISERENRIQFESFHTMLYDLKTTEFASTQLILIDKEYCPPPADSRLEVLARHMTPEDEEFPPLIPYYRGH
jgi:uncharacterized Zn finger protein (UPF0148 family)